MNFVVIWGLFLGLSCTAIPLAFAIGLTPLVFYLETGKYTPAVIFQSIVSINRRDHIKTRLGEDVRVILPDKFGIVYH